MLGAISDILSAAIRSKLSDGTSVVNVAQVSSVLMDLLRTQGPKILNTLTIPKFGKMYVLLLKLDHSTKLGTQDAP